MFTTFTKAIVLAAATMTFVAPSFADTAGTPAAPYLETYELAQTTGMDRRGDRRDDRRGDRTDRRGDRQDCRQVEGAVGHDKRDCKQGGRQDRNLNG